MFEICGVLNINESEFWNTTPVFFFGKLKGYYSNVEFLQIGEWEKTRWMTTAIIQPHIKKRLKPKDLISFTWEKAETITDEDVQRIKEKFKNYTDGIKKS